MTTSAYLNYIMYVEAMRDKLSNHLITYKLGALLYDYLSLSELYHVRWSYEGSAVQVFDYL